MELLVLLVGFFDLDKSDAPDYVGSGLVKFDGFNTTGPFSIFKQKDNAYISY